MAGAGGWHLIISKYFHSHRNCRWPFNLRVDSWATTFHVFHLHVLILQTRSGKNYIQGHWQCVLCPGYFHCISGHHKRRLSSQSVSQSCYLDCSSCDQPLAFTLTTVTPILLCLWTGPPLSWKIWDLVSWNFKSVEWIKSNLLKSQFKWLVPVRY